MIVQPIPPGARLFDTIETYTPTNLRALKDAGGDGVFMYLGGNATPDAVGNALALKMGVAFVNYSRGNGWLPSATLGEGDATTSRLRLTKLGVPTEGLVDACDLEGCGGDPTAYLQAWAHVVADQGRLAGLYVGAGDILSGPQLYALPGFSRYWRSCSMVPEPGCGWSLIQISPPNLERGGSQVDIDFACEDWRGRSWSWVVGS